MVKIKKKYKTMYMHTLNGSPAYYVKNKQICFADKIKIPEDLCSSLYQLRKELELNHIWRSSKGFKDHDWKYGYVIIKIKEDLDK